MRPKKITISSNIIEHLGSDLITSSDVAFMELIKNSLDASIKSKDKRIHISYFESLESFDSSNSLLGVDNENLRLLKEKYSNLPFYIIEDLGCGMTEEEIECGFLSIGTDIKKQAKSEENIILGEKGIGRLAAQRLGKHLVVETASITEEFSNIVEISWRELLNTTDILQFDVPYSRGRKINNSYTRLWIFDVNRSDFIHEEGQLVFFEDLQNTKLNSELDNAVSFLISPYQHNTSIPSLNFFYKGNKLSFGLDNKILDYCETVHSFKFSKAERCLELNLTINPWYVYRVHKTSIKPNTEFRKYKKNIDDYINLLEKYKERFDKTFNIIYSYDDLLEYLVRESMKDIKVSDKNSIERIRDIMYSKIEYNMGLLNAISPIEGRIFSYKKDSNYFDTVKKFNQCYDISISELQENLKKYNGVKLYRDKYRIGLLGNKESDWLKFQQYKSSGQQFYRFNLGTTLGEVVINDPNQNYIKEVSSRLEINKNETSDFLLNLLEKIFNEMFYKFNVSLKEMINNILFDEGWLQGNIKKKINLSDIENKTLEKSNKELKNKLNRTKKLLKNLAINNDGTRILSFSQYSEAMDTIQTAENQITDNEQFIMRNKEVINEAKAGLENIEIEAFNNYKLMANGLITETITHELHSVINKDYSHNTEMHFSMIEEYLLDNKMSYYNDYLLPIRDVFDNLTKSINSISDLYDFLESTFIKNNSKDEYAYESVSEIISEIENKFSAELKERNIVINQSISNQKWYLPRGVLLHVMYNLFNNSKYWIDIRRKRAKSDDFYDWDSGDCINIEMLGKDSIVIFDTGTGVKREMEYVLFEPLQSGKGPDGRGMGLYIVKKLLTSFGANIELLDETNKYGNKYKFLISVPEFCYERGIV